MKLKNYQSKKKTIKKRIELDRKKKINDEIATKKISLKNHLKNNNKNNEDLKDNEIENNF